MHLLQSCSVRYGIPRASDKADKVIPVASLISRKVSIYASMWLDRKFFAVLFKVLVAVSGEKFLLATRRERFVQLFADVIVHHLDCESKVEFLAILVCYYHFVFPFCLWLSALRTTIIARIACIVKGFFKSFLKKFYIFLNCHK